MIDNLPKPLHNESGMVLVLAMLIMTALILLGTTTLMETQTDLKIASNGKSRTIAFYAAEAGIEVARGQLRTDLGTFTVSQLLAARVGANGTLSNSTDVANFYGGGSFVTDDVPYIASTALGTGWYQVYLTNDAVDGVTSATDTNQTVTITSFGFSGSQTSPTLPMSVLQVTVTKIGPTDAPGALVMPGPNAICDPGSSGAKSINGGVTKPAIAVNSAVARTSVVGMITKPELITGGGLATPSVSNTVLGSPWDNVSALQDYRDSLSAAADFHSTSDSGFTLGTTANPKIVFITGDAEFGPGSGAGILVVTGELELKGNFSYNGLILVVGEGELEREGGGGGTILGSIVCANLTGSPTTFGTAEFETEGGGNSTIQYDAAALSMAFALTGGSFVKKTWRDLSLK